MNKYRFRYLIAVGLLLTIPAFTCGVGPILRDLIARVELLEAESDAELVTIDANGVQVGNRTYYESYTAWSLFEHEGIPFLLRVNRERLSGTSGTLYFESPSCEGQAYITPGPTVMSSVLPFVAVVGSPTTPVHVADRNEMPRVVELQSQLTGHPYCQRASGVVEGIPVIPAFTWQDEFTPPFEVVTREEFLAMQEGEN
jgi:hypothetical protein